MGFSFKKLLNPVTAIGTAIGGPILGLGAGYLHGDKKQKAEEAHQKQVEQEAADRSGINQRYADVLRPAYSASERFGGEGGEKDLMKRSGDALKMREGALGGYNAPELIGLRNQLTGSAKAQTAQNIRSTMAGQGRMGVSGATAGAQVQAVRQAGQQEEQSGREKLMLMQKEAKEGALDKYETDVLGRQLAITGDETGRQQMAIAMRGQDLGIAANPVVQKSGSITMLCAITIGNGLLPDDLMASEVLIADKMMPYLVGPAVMAGYVFLFKWAANLAEKNKVFAKIVSFFVIAWMRDTLTDRKNKLGYIINKYGRKLCGLVGRLIV